MARLWNWAEWARQGMGGPDNSCQNSIWANWNPYGSGREEGWGEPEAAPDVPECDEDDAERMDCLVLQLSRPMRAILVRRFVLRQRVGWQEVDPAVRAIADLIEANWRVVERMR